MSEAFHAITEVDEIEASCGLRGYKPGIPLYLAGDVAFADLPAANSAYFRDLGRTYASGRTLYDPMASPSFAPPVVLEQMRPIQLHTAISEVLSGEASMFATNLAIAGAAVELNLYDGMWHCFPHYYTGCDESHNGTLLFAHVSLNRTAQFLQSLSSNGGSPPFKLNGVPFTLLHYEYPQGHDTTSGVIYSNASDCAE